MAQVPKGLTPVQSGIPKGLTPVKSDDQDPLESMIKSEFIRSRPKEEARRLLKARSRKFSTMSLDEQDKLLAGLPGAPEGVKSSASQKIETGAKRFALGMVDLPGQVKEAAVKQPTEQEVGRHRRHPGIFAEPQRGAGLFLDRLLLDPQISEYQKSQKTQGMEKAGHLGAAIVPFYGPVAGHFGESLGKGEFLESLGEAGAAYLASFLFKGMTKEVEPFKRMATAAGGKARDFEVVAPDLASEANKFGRPVTVGNMQDLVIRTGKDLETEFGLRLQPFAGDQRIPTEVAQELLNKANSSHLAQTPEGRATRNLLRQKALDYQKPWTLGELNKQRMDMFDARMEAKTQTGQMAAMRSSAETMANKIIEDKLRDIVYDDMQQRYGGAIDFRKMKEKQARILDIMDRMEKQVETLADAQAELESAGLTEKLGLSLSGHFGGVTPRVHGLLKTLKGGPQKVADVQVRKAFPATLKDIRTKAGAKDLASQGVRHMTRQAIRNLPLASFFEEEKPDKKPVDKK